MNFIKFFKFKPNNLSPNPRRAEPSGRRLTPKLGFTLIELLIVFSISATLAGIGIASFVKYSQAQQVNQAANDIKLLISQARYNALSSVKTAKDLDGTTINCPNTISASPNPLRGYNVTFGSGVDSDKIYLTMDCTIGANLTTNIKVIKLPTGVTFGTPICSTISFASLTQSSSGLPCNIPLTSLGGNKTVTIDKNGNTFVQ